MDLKADGLELIDRLKITTPDLPDYKFFCFNGEVKMLYVATERQSGEAKFDFFDADFRHLPFQQAGHPNATELPVRPKHLEQMKRLAEQLSQGKPHVRVDFYEVGDRIYFGEMTFYSMSGMAAYSPQEWDYRLGEWLTLQMPMG